ncbi:conserved Plasmodium membrane protein, unknown function [Plasmodium sp. DRC-Itaito]|nr:conserved Plasmodium membrane protein, unknown function [Plasmodium sp. DRC-Itaito]
MDLIKKEEYDVNSFLMNTVNIKDKVPDQNLLININNSYLALYPTTENVNVPEVHINEDIDKVCTNENSNIVEIGNPIIKENEQAKEELYKKLSPTIGSLGYDKNKKSIKQGNDFWFTNNLQLLPIKIKKICMNEGMISLIDKKHNLYIAGNNTFLGSKSEFYFKRVKSKDNYVGKMYMVNQKKYMKNKNR